MKKDSRTIYELVSSGTHKNNVALYKCRKNGRCFYKKVAFSSFSNRLIENEKKGYDWFCKIAEKDYQVILSRNNFFEIEIPEFRGKIHPRNIPLKGCKDEVEIIIDFYKKYWLNAQPFSIHGDLAISNIILSDGEDINIIDWEHFHLADPIYFGFDIFNMLFIALRNQFKKVESVSKKTKAFLKSCYNIIIDGIPASNQILEKPFQNSSDYLIRFKHKFGLCVEVTDKYALAKSPQRELEQLDLLIT